MENKSENPSAFPCHNLIKMANGGSQIVDTGGMTLRDYFAAKAMQSIVERAYNDVSWDNSYEQIAAMAYLQADAMLKERENTKNK